MTDDMGSDAMATGMKTGNGLPATIEADATNGSLLDLRPLSARFPASGRQRAMSNTAL